jgi:hypothetical protein
MKNILFILSISILLLCLLIFYKLTTYKTNTYKSFNEGYSSIIPINCNDPNNNNNLLRYDCR